MTRLRNALYWHGHEVKADDIADLEVLDGGITLVRIDEREPIDDVFRRDIGLDVEILPRYSEEDVMRCGVFPEELAKHHLVQWLPIVA